MIRSIALLALIAAADAAGAKPPQLPQEGQSARYVCTDGRAIEVLYGGGVAVLTIAGTTQEMARAPAADGERYVGGGWQWWGKGKRNGTLARLAQGEDVASGGVSCRAP